MFGVQRICTGEGTTNKLEDERDVENFIDYVEDSFQLTPPDNQKRVREIYADFKKTIIPPNNFL